jgi:hypothetical protein
VGQEVTFFKFLSSSKLEDVAEQAAISNGGDVILIVQGKTGKVVESASRYPEEAEVLFNTEKQFQVINKYQPSGETIMQVTLKEL